MYSYIGYAHHYQASESLTLPLEEIITKKLEVASLCCATEVNNLPSVSADCREEWTV